MPTYPGGERIDTAQAVLDRHAVSSANGLCLASGVPGPCAPEATGGGNSGTTAPQRSNE